VLINAQANSLKYGAEFHSELPRSPSLGRIPQKGQPGALGSISSHGKNSKRWASLAARMKNQCEGISALHRIHLWHDHRYQ
jgi:hypothetical protein